MRTARCSVELSIGRRPLRLPGPSDGSGRACAPRSAASAAWRLAMALTARLAPLQSRGFLHRQVRRARQRGGAARGRRLHPLGAPLPVRDRAARGARRGAHGRPRARVLHRRPLKTDARRTACVPLCVLSCDRRGLARCTHHASTRRHKLWGVFVHRIVVSEFETAQDELPGYRLWTFSSFSNGCFCPLYRNHLPYLEIPKYFGIPRNFGVVAHLGVSPTSELVRRTTRLTSRSATVSSW